MANTLRRRQNTKQTSRQAWDMLPSVEYAEHLKTMLIFLFQPGIK